MTKLHQKLSQTYQWYQRHHEHVLHRQYHWSLLTVFSLVVGASLVSSLLSLSVSTERVHAQSNNWLPPAGTPLANKEHPRLYFTADSLPQVKSRILQHYKPEFQSFVNQLDSVYNESAASQDRRDLLHDTRNYAFLCAALKDPMSGIAQGHTRAQYCDKAIEYALQIGNTDYNDARHDSQNWVSTKGGLVNLSLALSYDWTYDYASLSQRQSMANIMINKFDTRDDDAMPPHTDRGFLNNQVTTPTHSGTINPLAFWGDPLGASIENRAQEMLNYFNQAFHHGMLDVGEIVCEGGFCSQEGSSYSWDVGGTLPYIAGPASTALDTNYFARDHIRTLPLWTYFMRLPQQVDGKWFSQTHDTGGPGNNELDANCRAINDCWDVPRRFMNIMAYNLKDDDPTMAAFASWFVQESPYAARIDQYRYAQSGFPDRRWRLFENFLGGTADVPPQSPDELGMDLMQRLGERTVMRSSFDEQTSTRMSIESPQYFFCGGHNMFDQSGIQLAKYGNLMVKNGNSKSDDYCPRLSGSGKSPSFANITSIVGGSEMEFPMDVPRDCPLNAQDLNNSDYRIGTLRAHEHRPDLGFDFFSYDYTRSYRDTNAASEARQDIVYVRGGNNNEFFVERNEIISGSQKQKVMHFAADVQPDDTGSISSARVFRVTNNYLDAHGKLYVHSLAPSDVSVQKFSGGWTLGDGSNTGGSISAMCQYLTGSTTLHLKSNSSTYLTVYEPGDSNTMGARSVISRIDAGNMDGAFIDGQYVVMIAKDMGTLSSTGYTLNTSGPTTHILTGFASNNSYQVTIGGQTTQVTATQDGTLHFNDSTTGAHTISVGGGTPPPADTTPPTIDTFDVQPRITETNTTVTWSVRDNQSLARVEVWRAPYNDNGCSNTNRTNCSWASIHLQNVSGSSHQGSYTDSPVAGTYWYGLHVIDTAANLTTESAPIQVTKEDTSPPPPPPPPPTTPPPPPGGRIIHVDSHAASGGNGSEQAPYRTIQQALNTLQAGDSVVVHGDASGAGRVYQESLALIGNGQLGNPITLSSYQNDRVIVKHQNTISFNKNYWVIQDLIFDHNNVASDAFEVSGDEVRFEGIELRNGTRDGFDISGSARDIIIDNATIHNFFAGDRDAHCIVANPGMIGLTVRDSRIYDCGGDGIQLFAESGQDPSEYVRNVSVTGSTFYTTQPASSENGLDIKGVDDAIFSGNDIYGFTSNKAVVFQKGPRNVVFQNNRIHDSQRGIEIRGEGGFHPINIDVFNNLIYGTTDFYAVKFDEVEGLRFNHNTIANIIDGSPLQIEEEGVISGSIQNNIISNADDPVVSGSNQATVSHNGWFDADAGPLHGTGDVVGTDAGFVSMANHDYHLTSQSHARDRGANLAYISHDFDGVSRPHGNGYDLGAYEYRGSQPPVGDTIAPVVSLFDVQPRITETSVTASFHVTDNQSLARVELWRAPYNDNGCSNTNRANCAWGQVQEQSITGISVDGTLIDSPPIGVFWYGLHVIDQAGNVGYEPNSVSIQKVSTTPPPGPPPTPPPSGNPEVYVEKSVNVNEAENGDILTFTLRYSNPTSYDAINVVITDEIPDNTVYVSNSATGGGSYNTSSRSLQWNLGRVSGQSSGSVQFRAQVSVGATSPPAPPPTPTPPAPTPPPSPPDTTPPVIDEFDVQPRTSTSDATVSWMVRDNKQLSRIEVWRAGYDATGCSESNKTGCSWAMHERVVVDGTSDSRSIPLSLAVGRHWIGLHAIDEAGNVGYEPNPPGSILYTREGTPTPPPAPTPPPPPAPIPPPPGPPPGPTAQCPAPNERGGVIAITGSEAPDLINVATDRVIAYHYSNGWQRVPIQVDERERIALGLLYVVPSALTDTVWQNDAHGTDDEGAGVVDANDEIAFAYSSLSSRAPTQVSPPAGVSNTRVEVSVTDPANGSTGYIYIFISNQSVARLTGTGISYTRSEFPCPYDDSGDVCEDTDIQATCYSTHFSNQWVQDSYKITTAANGSGTDILDRWHGFAYAPGRNAAFVTNFGEHEDNRKRVPGLCGWSEQNGEHYYIGHKTGPVRAIRQVRGACSFPDLIRIFKYAPDETTESIIFRGHGFGGQTGGIGMIYDHHASVSPLTYYSASLPQGVQLDGQPDFPGVNVAPITPAEAEAGLWFQVSSSHGGWLMHVTQTQSFPNPAENELALYMDDRSNFNDLTGSEPGLVGGYGFRYLSLENTETTPNPPTFETVIRPIGNNLANTGAQFKAMIDQQLIITVE